MLPVSQGTDHRLETVLATAPVNIRLSAVLIRTDDMKSRVTSLTLRIRTRLDPHLE